MEYQYLRYIKIWSYFINSSSLQISILNKAREISLIISALFARDCAFSFISFSWMHISMWLIANPLYHTRSKVQHTQHLTFRFMTHEEKDFKIQTIKANALKDMKPLHFLISGRVIFSSFVLSVWAFPTPLAPLIHLLFPGMSLLSPHWRKR